jgi:uncharacterized protein (TIGR03435 family)
MEWNPESVPGPGGAGNAPAAADLDARPALITAFQEQLGLKLQPATTPVDVIVIDSVDRPTPD